MQDGVNALERKDRQQAIAIWTGMAEGSNPRAALKLARLYDTGANQNLEFARRFYRQAAQGGIASAQLRLAAIAYRGIGASRTWRLAVGGTARPPQPGRFSGSTTGPPISIRLSRAPTTGLQPAWP